MGGPNLSTIGLLIVLKWMGLALILLSPVQAMLQGCAALAAQAVLSLGERMRQCHKYQVDARPLFTSSSKKRPQLLDRFSVFSCSCVNIFQPLFNAVECGRILSNPRPNIAVVGDAAEDSTEPSRHDLKVWPLPGRWMKRRSCRRSRRAFSIAVGYSVKICPR